MDGVAAPSARAVDVDDETVGRLLAKKWWDGSPEELEAVAGSFWDVRAFVNKEESIVP